MQLRWIAPPTWMFLATWIALDYVVLYNVCNMYVHIERVVIPAQEFPVQGTTRHYLGVVNTPLLAWHSDRRKIIYFFFRFISLPKLLPT